MAVKTWRERDRQREGEGRGRARGEEGGEGKGEEEEGRGKGEVEGEREEGIVMTLVLIGDKHKFKRFAANRTSCPIKKENRQLLLLSAKFVQLSLSCSGRNSFYNSWLCIEIF